MKMAYHKKGNSTLSEISEFDITPREDPNSLKGTTELPFKVVIKSKLCSSKVAKKAQVVKSREVSRRISKTMKLPPTIKKVTPPLIRENCFILKKNREVLMNKLPHSFLSSINNERSYTNVIDKRKIVPNFLLKVLPIGIYYQSSTRKPNNTSFSPIPKRKPLTMNQSITEEYLGYSPTYKWSQIESNNTRAKKKAEISQLLNDKEPNNRRTPPFSKNCVNLRNVIINRTEKFRKMLAIKFGKQPERQKTVKRQDQDEKYLKQVCQSYSLQKITYKK
jgi:hypothetical protein